jgi:hypothetical protein
MRLSHFACWFGCVAFLIWPAAAQSPAKPVSAQVVNVDPEYTEWTGGDIEMTSTDGMSTRLTHEHTCARPEVSSHGDVGWSVWLDVNDGKYEHSGEVLRVRRRDGTLADFRPNSRFVMGWNFTATDSAVAIASMGYHGSTFYIEYDLKTGRILDRIDEYTPYAKLPAWAQPISDEKP